MKKTLIFILPVIIYSLAYADTVYLKNGRNISGIIKEEDNQSVELEVSGGAVKFRKSEIERISKSGLSETARLREKMEKDYQESRERMHKRRLIEEQKPKDIEFSRDSGGILLKARINDEADATFILDTGASVMMIKRELAEDLGFNFNNAKPDVKITVADGREVNAKRIVLKSVRVQNSEARNVEAAVLLEDYGGEGLHDGLLGMSFLKNFNFKIDYSQNKLTLEKLS